MATEAVQTTYLWQGTDKQGNKTKGEIQGSSQALVKAQLFIATLLQQIQQLQQLQQQRLTMLRF